MPSKVPGRLCLVNDNGNSEKYVLIFKSFFILNLVKQYEDSDIIFVDDKVPCHKCRIVFFSESNIPQME